MAASTTTWYAYKDSKTGREYFHEPISGKTSWILPTSASIDLSDTIEENIRGSESSTKLGITSKTNRNSQQQQQQPTMKVMDKQSRSWAVGIITSVIIFNTIFLLVLTSYLYTNQVPEQINITSNDGINIVQIPVEDRDEYIIQIDNADVDNISKETTYKYTIQSESDGKTIIDDVHQDTDTQTPEEEHTTTDDVEEKDIYHESEYSSDCKSNRGDTNEDDYQADLHKAHAHEPISTDISTDKSGKSCWVPFSYMLVGKCRMQAREGFGPLADADNTLWI